MAHLAFEGNPPGLSFPGGSDSKESTCNAGDLVQFLGWEDPLEKDRLPTPILGLLWWLSWQRIFLQCGRPGFDSWVGKIPWRRGRLPSPIFWPGEFHGLYSPWGHKELDRTQQLSLILPAVISLVKAMVFPVVMYGCESCTIKKAEHQRIDAFELWCWRRLLRVP